MRGAGERALRGALAGGPYQAYTYGYPHKTAYRPLASPVPLRTLWAGEDRRHLFLYLHVPFCEMRCGFCNLLTTVNAPQGLVSGYLDALERQVRTVSGELNADGQMGAAGGTGFSRLALGGGTPTFLTAPELERVFGLLEQYFAVSPARVPTSVETSPATALPERLAALRRAGVGRVSIGVQSFVEAEVRGVGRAQSSAQVEAALTNIRAAGFPLLNLDLIYGLAHQTPSSWQHSLEAALAWAPEELFLYPLYVRPLTGIGRLGRSWDDERLELYRLGRELLLSRGYEQTSMRRFRRAGLPEAGTSEYAEPEYTCQQDGMVGLGAGARSYTRGLHYSSEYAVGALGVREIVQDYAGRGETDFARASYGALLDPDEQRRRFVLQSLLHVSGLELARFGTLYGGDPRTAYPLLGALEEAGLAVLEDGTLRLTPAGLEQSDALGPALYSPSVRALSGEYAWR